MNQSENSIEKKLPHAEEQREMLYYTRSQEAQDIIGKMPPWIIRTGIGAMLLLFIIIAVASMVIRFPESIDIPVLIRPAELPIQLNAPVSGIVEKALLQDGQYVREKQTLLVLAPADEYEAVIKLQVFLQRLDSGILFQKPNIFIIDDSLGALLPAEFTGSFVRLKAALVKMKTGRNSYAHEERLGSIISKLLDGLEQWKQKNTISAPTSGTIVFLRTIYRGIPLQKGEDIFAIIPTPSQVVTIAGFVPTQNIEKIHLGDKVKISLPEFPRELYGVLKASVSTISPVAFEGHHRITLVLSEGMKTTKGRRLNGSTELKGVGQVETKRTQSLFGKIFLKDGE